MLVKRGEIEMNIPFNNPFITGKELLNIKKVIEEKSLAGDGLFTKRANEWLERTIGCKKALLTNSCTAALEMAAILTDIMPGDEVIMPSYTFVSTANAFVLRGGVPVFVDIRPDTLNIDEKKIEEAITSKTRAIVAVHYAGVACEMDTILDIANRHGLLVIEDAAQGMLATYKKRPLGSMGHLAALSFHETKNIVCGEGGALLVNDPSLMERSEIILEKGTNRSKFFRGEIDKYTWVDIGSSYLPGEITAAFLLAQFEQARYITGKRWEIWRRYNEAFSDLENRGLARRPICPPECLHNAHIYYLLLPDLMARTKILGYLKEMGIGATFHYVPLHASPAGKRYGRAFGDLSLTTDLSERLVRLPLWVGMGESDIEQVDNEVINAINNA